MPIEEYRHTARGYNPILIGSRWQVAQLNFEPELAPGSIHKIDVHHHTDETFLLMAGQAVLIAAEMNPEGIAFEVRKMKPKVVYNIPKGSWHNIALSADAEVLITEDANTHLGDYAFHYLSAREKAELKALIEAAWYK